MFLIFRGLKVQNLNDYAKMLNFAKANFIFLEKIER